MSNRALCRPGVSGAASAWTAGKLCRQCWQCCHWDQRFSPPGWLFPVLASLLAWVTLHRVMSEQPVEHSAQELLNTVIFLMIPHELPGLGCHPPAKEHEASPRAALPNISHQQSHSHLRGSFLADEGKGLSFTSCFFQHLALPQAWQGSAIPVARSCESSQSGDVSLNATVQFSL